MSQCTGNGINTEKGCKCFTPYIGKNCTSIFQSCASNSFFDPIHQKCICKEGFGGENCDTCIKVNNLLFIIDLQNPHLYPDLYFVCIGTEGKEGSHQLFTLTKESIQQLLQQNDISLLFPSDSGLDCDCRVKGESVIHEDIWKALFHKSTYPNGFIQPDDSCDPCDETASLIVGIIAICSFAVMSAILITTVVMVNRKKKNPKDHQQLMLCLNGKRIYLIIKRYYLFNSFSSTSELSHIPIL